MRPAQFIVESACETHDTFDAGQDYKGYKNQLKTRVVTTKGIFLITLSSKYFLNPLYKSTYNSKDHKENNETKQYNQVKVYV